MEAADNEIQKKQMLLQQEIIDKNLDKTLFINFCLSKKENGDDLSNWTLPELQAIVKEFADSQNQPQSPSITLQDQITHPNPNTQNPQQEEINKESVEKLEKFSADEDKNFKKEKVIECRKLDKTELNNKNISIEVKNPTEKVGFFE